MDSYFSSTTTTTEPGGPSTASPFASFPHIFNPEDFFAMPNPTSRPRPSTRTATTTAELPSFMTARAAHTRAALARSSTSFDSYRFVPSYPIPTAAINVSPARATRKRRHHGAENPEGPDGRPVSSPPNRRAAKRRKTSKLKSPPPSIKVEDSDKKPAAKACGANGDDQNCCICMCEVEPEDLSKINGCKHSFCFGCIEKWSERENTCPLCKSRFTTIDRVNKKRKKGAKNTKKVRQRDQRSDLMPGAAIEGLLASLSASRNGSGSAGLARLIFGVANAASATGNGSNSSAGTDASQPFSFVDSSDEDDDNPYSFLRTFDSRGPHGFRFSAFSSAGGTATDPAASFSIRYTSAASSTRAPQPPRMSASESSSTRVAQPPRMFTHSYFVRSHATNENDVTAGSNRNNPLEIQDDSSDDNSVEILEVN